MLELGIICQTSSVFGILRRKESSVIRGVGKTFWGILKGWVEVAPGREVVR
jgi:hypothetical protein